MPPAGAWRPSRSAWFSLAARSGAARDAARDEARDAGLKDQLAAQQATRIVQRYFPPTGTPAPTEPPAPALGQIALTFGFRPDGTPDGSYASVPAGAGTVYVATRLTGLSVGQKVRAIVTDAWGNEVATPEVVIDPGAADRWLALPVGLPAELAPGEYGVFIFADDRPLGSLGVRRYRRGNVRAASPRDAGQSPSAQHSAAAGCGAGRRTTDSCRWSSRSDSGAVWLDLGHQVRNDLRLFPLPPPRGSHTIRRVEALVRWPWRLGDSPDC